MHLTVDSSHRTLEPLCPYLEKALTMKGVTGGLQIAASALGAAALTLVLALAIQHHTVRRLKKRRAPKRIGGAIQLRKQMYDRYTQLHDSVWIEVLKRMHKSNIRNFTLYYHEETQTLFSHFEWVGNQHGGTDEEVEENFKKDMNAVATDAAVKEWWSQCEPCQNPFSQWPAGAIPPSRQTFPAGDWWAPLKCLCHCGHWPVLYYSAHRDPGMKPNNPRGLTSTRKDPAPDGTELRWQQSLP